MERIAIEMITPEGQGYRPVEVKFVVNEAVVRAHFDGREAITYEDMRHAMETREYGLRQKISGARSRTSAGWRTMRPATPSRCSALHAQAAGPLTLMQYGEIRGAEGVAFDKAKEEIHITTKEELLVDIQIYLASKAAEIVFLGTEAGMGDCRALASPERSSTSAAAWAASSSRCGARCDAGRAPTGRAGHAAAVPRPPAGGGEPAAGPRDRRGAAGEGGLLGEEVEEIVARIDREVGRTTGRVVDLPTPQPPALPGPGGGGCRDGPLRWRPPPLRGTGAGAAHRPRRGVP